MPLRDNLDPGTSARFRLDLALDVCLDPDIVEFRIRILQGTTPEVLADETFFSQNMIPECGTV